MTPDMAESRAVSFGEVVFDRFNDHVCLGGAPLNVAWNLHQIGLPVTLVSAVGRDALAAEVRQFLTAAGIDQSFVFDRPEPTGVADVTLIKGVVVPFLKIGKVGRVSGVGQEIEVDDLLDAFSGLLEEVAHKIAADEPTSPGD